MRRLLIGPVNFAGQGTRWARVLEEQVPTTKVTAFAFANGVLDYPVDYRVSASTYRRHRRWQLEFYHHVVQNYTHVLIEANRPIFGVLHHFSWAAQAEVVRSVYAEVLGGLPEAAYGPDATKIRELLPDPPELQPTNWTAYRRKHTK
ncbi:hypothetical protein ACIA49_05450 [Kribbella sp. NPDC051587]|uniref:hypothetical protein n=1 Tax=Kribbella sp. NPDC051587 TaxID=3364119 RepID=UPI0037B7F2C5